MHDCVCSTAQYTATHCNTLQHTATHCLQDVQLQRADGLLFSKRVRRLSLCLCVCVCMIMYVCVCVTVCVCDAKELYETFFFLSDSGLGEAKERPNTHKIIRCQNVCVAVCCSVLQ